MDASICSTVESFPTRAKARLKVATYIETCYNRQRPRPLSEHANLPLQRGNKPPARRFVQKSSAVELLDYSEIHLEERIFGAENRHVPGSSTQHKE